MNEQAGQFRSAAIGGFHRQDVLDHLEQLTRAHQAEKEALLAEKAAAEAALEEETAARKRAENRLFLLQQQAAEATEHRQDHDTALADLNAQLAQKEEALAQAEQQAEALRRRVEELEPAARSWQRIKDTAGDIEVAAHERAQITLQEAETKAAEVRAEAARRMRDIQTRCDRLQTDLRTAVEKAEARLDTARSSFSLALEEIQGFHAALDRLIGTDADETPGQAPQAPSSEGGERRERPAAKSAHAAEYPAPMPGSSGRPRRP